MELGDGLAEEFGDEGAGLEAGGNVCAGPEGACRR